MGMIVWCASASSVLMRGVPFTSFPPQFSSIKITTSSSSSSSSSSSISSTRRRVCYGFPALVCTFISSTPPSNSTSIYDFLELPNSGGVKALDLRIGSGDFPSNEDQVAIHYYGRLAAKQGWRFDSTYDHKDETGEPIPFVFILGSGKVIPGIEAAVRSMRVGGLRRTIIPPSQGYQNTSQEPIPPNLLAILSK